MCLARCSECYILQFHSHNILEVDNIFSAFTQSEAGESYLLKVLSSKVTVNWEKVLAIYLLLYFLLEIAVSLNLISL